MLLYKTVVVGKSPTASIGSAATAGKIGSAGIGEAVESIPMVLKRVTRNPIFWLMLLGKMSLMCVGQFISFMPLYLQTGFAMPSPKAAAASSLFALGSLTASLLLIPSYQKMASSMQTKTIAGLNLFNFALPGLLWAHHTGSRPSIRHPLDTNNTPSIFTTNTIASSSCSLQSSYCAAQPRYHRASYPFPLGC